MYRNIDLFLNVMFLYVDSVSSILKALNMYIPSCGGHHECALAARSILLFNISFLTMKSLSKENKS